MCQSSYWALHNFLILKSHFRDLVPLWPSLENQRLGLLVCQVQLGVLVCLVSMSGSAWGASMFC